LRFTADGLGMIKNEAGKIFGRIADNNFTAKAIKDGVIIDVPKTAMKDVALDVNTEGKLVAKINNEDYELVEEGTEVVAVATDEIVDWTNVIGKNIDELTEPPKGYEFYNGADGKKWIRQKDASDLSTARLTVKDGKIAKYADGIIDQFFNSIDDFANTFDKGKQLSQYIRSQAFDLYKEQNWSKLEQLFDVNNINGKWPPANGGFNTVKVSLKKGQIFDRYQYQAKIDPLTNEINYTGGYASPIDNGKVLDFESRALKGVETDYDLYYKVEIIRDFDFEVEQGNVIPWWGHSGKGKQIALPEGKLIQDLINAPNPYIKITPIKSPNNNVKF
jgi:hypothetical protein